MQNIVSDVEISVKLADKFKRSEKRAFKCPDQHSHLLDEWLSGRPTSVGYDLGFNEISMIKGTIFSAFPVSLKATEIDY